MTADEIRFRSIYLFLECSRAVEQCAGRLAASVSAPSGPDGRPVEQVLRRELGLLFRYWTTRQIWERLASNEADAKALNLALLRLCTEAFRLPRDGSGLRYAELSTLTEEVQELSRRLASALGPAPQPLLSELPGAVAAWRDAVTRSTVEALELPLDQLTVSVQAWMERSPDA